MWSICECERVYIRVRVSVCVCLCVGLCVGWCVCVCVCVVWWCRRVWVGCMPGIMASWISGATDRDSSFCCLATAWSTVLTLDANLLVTSFARTDCGGDMDGILVQESERARVGARASVFECARVNLPVRLCLCLYVPACRSFGLSACLSTCMSLCVCVRCVCAYVCLSAWPRCAVVSHDMFHPPEGVQSCPC